MSTLTAVDALQLADVIRAVHAGSRIEWTTDGERVFTGTLRHIVDASGSSVFQRHGADVRDGWVRITMVSGTDTWIRVSGLATLMATGYAAVTA